MLSFHSNGVLEKGPGMRWSRPAIEASPWHASSETVPRGEGESCPRMATRRHEWEHMLSKDVSGFALQGQLSRKSWVRHTVGGLCFGEAHTHFLWQCYLKLKGHSGFGEGGELQPALTVGDSQRCSCLSAAWDPVVHTCMAPDFSMWQVSKMVLRERNFWLVHMHPESCNCLGMAHALWIRAGHIIIRRLEPLHFGNMKVKDCQRCLPKFQECPKF